MKKKSRVALSLVLIAIAICLTVVGYTFGNPVVILQKAVNVCLECIGIS
jgi:hypothetical protein